MKDLRCCRLKCFKLIAFKMAILLRNKKIILSGLLTSFATDDIDFEKFKTIEGLYINDPWERVKSIFTVDDFGNWHPELIYTYHMTQVGAITGGVLGGVYQALKDTNKFLRTNDTQIYANVKEAHRALNQLNILSVLKGACKWAPRFAIFCGGFILISSCCELYYNKHRIINNTIAGTSIGALFKASFGIKGIISGGIIGGILGTLYGIAFWGIYKISNINHIQFKYAHFAYMKYKEQLNSKKNPNNKSVFDNISVISDFNTLNESEIEENSVQENENLKK